MKKTRQQELSRWLKQQSAFAHRWLIFSHFLGLISGVLIVAQAWLLAGLLSHMIMDNIPREALLLSFVLLIMVFILRAWLVWLREKVGFRTGRAIRLAIRTKVLDRLHQAGPAWIQGKPVGSWATLVLEQIEDMHDYYARYLPQMGLAVTVPLLILVAIFPINWAAALILFITAPLIPIFMAMVGMGAAEANRRNFLALSRLSGHFLDRLRGMETLRLFNRAAAETEQIREASEAFRERTMEVLRLAFLSSGVLEFFASLSIALVAVYFGFSYLGELNFGHYQTGITLFAGFLALMLAPEFFQPLRDLGAFYHAKAQATGAADSLMTFLDTPLDYPEKHHPEKSYPEKGEMQLNDNAPFTLEARDMTILSAGGHYLAGPLNFTLQAGLRVVLVGQSGAGKSSLINALSGFLPYQGSLRVNGVELTELSAHWWHKQISWVGQNPQLPAATLRENVLLAAPNADDTQLNQALDKAYVSEFISLLPLGIDTPLSQAASPLSIGQAQRVALARALLLPCKLLLLDEPTASLDAHSEHCVMSALNNASLQQSTLMVTHQLSQIAHWDTIWVMRGGQIIQQGDFATLTATDGPFATLLAHRQEDI